MVELAADNAKLAFQEFAYAEDLKVSLTDKFNEERKKISEGAGLCKLKREPSIVYSTLTNLEFKRRTGFKTKSILISLVIIVCNRNHDIMKKTIISLTWFEEWFLYFEVIWGRTLTRWIDTEKEYRMSRSCCRDMFDSKLSMMISCRDSWPQFASYMEDSYLRKYKWNDKYEGKKSCHVG